MKPAWEEVAFHEYLEAKYEVDSLSINQGVFDTFLEKLASRTSFEGTDPDAGFPGKERTGPPRNVPGRGPAANPVRILDLGTGTGSMVRRLAERLGESRIGKFHILGIDSSEQSLAEARERTQGIPGAVEIEFAKADWPEAGNHLEDHSFHAVTALSFMDLVPLQEAVETLGTLLPHRGLFYSALNYDGKTGLLPLMEEDRFEQEVLAWYDESMEQRRFRGKETGGSRCGSRLYSSLVQSGQFQVHSIGASDWCLLPGMIPQKRYTAFLGWILGRIYAEARESGHFEGRKLEEWFRFRRRQLETNILGLVVHQVDILAERTG
ncbi:MAG: methyltransferase domain-containing protein [Spirochaetales bacterium]